MRTFLILSSVFGTLVLLAILESFSSAGEEADVSGNFGAAIPGLNTGQLATFEFGRSIFKKSFTRREGLGPHFNATSCASCHEDPVEGGSSQHYRDFFLAGRLNQEGILEKIYPDCTEFNAPSQRTECCLPSMVIPHYGPRGDNENPVASGVEHPSLSQADVVAIRNAPPMFGLGLFRLVSDEEILSRADPQDANGDGISGRINRIEDENNQIGRFGYKCQTASIEAFNRGALNNQMGITSNSIEFAMGPAQDEKPFLDELFEIKTAYAQVAAPMDELTDYDGIPDPELSRGELIALVFFQENLAAPRRGRITSSVRQGESVFLQLGCTSCHTASLNTRIGKIHPYTDLLLHDMGPELADGITMKQALGNEFRTQPLWGLCEHSPFLHDGRAATVRDAILLHGGEAERARNAYAELNQRDTLMLHRFLESL